MKKTLYLKLLGSYLIFALIAFVIVGFFTQFQITKNEQKAEAMALYREANQIAENYARQVFKPKMEYAEYIQNEMETLAKYNDSQILLIKPNGDIILNSADRKCLEKALDSEYEHLDGFNITDFGNRLFRIGRFYDLHDKDQLIVYATVTTNYQLMGYVIIMRDANSVALSANTYMGAVFLSMLLVIAASFIILIFFTFLVYRPLRKITLAADEFAQGDFSNKIDVKSHDEMGILAHTLNYMAEELRSQEEEQRKFISNVSHDFRSPLTSIKGYCEAMLDGTIPPEMQDRYLNIILTETDRLNKLTQSLLELNRFGKHERSLDIAEFDINQMIKNVLMTFEGICFKRHITFDLVLTGTEMFVVADMSKIQQVLYNLVDNAIKFSHNDSAIKIETSVKKDKLFVSVKDHGIGIPTDSLKKIWERFYKTDASRGRDKRGVGLGLSIVKEILAVHKQNIDVISTEGVGTEFIFTLDIAQRSL